MNSIIKTFKQFFFWIFNYHLSPQLDGWVHIQSKSPENMAWFIWLVMDFLFLCLICTNVPQSTNDEFSNRIFQQLFEFSSSCSRTLDLRGSLKGFTIYLLDRSWIAPSSALIFQSFCYGSTTVEYRQSLYAAVFRSAQSVPHDRSWIVPWSLRSFCTVCQWTSQVKMEQSNSHLDSIFTFLPDTFSTGSCCYTGIFSKASACSLVNKVQGSI